MSAQRERREAERRHRVCGPPVARVVCVWHLQPTEMHRVSVWRVSWAGPGNIVCVAWCVCRSVLHNLSVCARHERVCVSRDRVPRE